METLSNFSSQNTPWQILPDSPLLCLDFRFLRAQTVRSVLKVMLEANELHEMEATNISFGVMGDE